MEAFDPLRRIAERSHGRNAYCALGRRELPCRHRELARGEGYAVESLGEIEQRRVALGGRAVEHPRHARRAEGGRVQPPDRLAASSRIDPMRALTRAWAVLSEARFTMRRAVDVMISATSTRPLARSVSPDWTRSTMRSASPTSGASSMEPSRWIISTCMPRSEK